MRQTVLLCKILNQGEGLEWRYRERRDADLCWSLSAAESSLGVEPRRTITDQMDGTSRKEATQSTYWLIHLYILHSIPRFTWQPTHLGSQHSGGLL